MDNFAFWRERQSEFENFHKQYPDFTAHWNPANNGWWFQYGSTVEGIQNPPRELGSLLNAVARSIIAAFPEILVEVANVEGPRVHHRDDPCQHWLDFMRLHQQGFGGGLSYAIPLSLWEEGVKDGVPLSVVRRLLDWPPFNDDRVYEKQE